MSFHSRFLSLTCVASLALGSFAARAQSTEVDWAATARHSLAFFNERAWLEDDGVYLSEIDFTGGAASRKVHLMALSRMIYGLAHGGGHDRVLMARARRAAAFLRSRLVREDALGPYFLSSIELIPGGEVGGDDKLVVNEQAYGLNGLVALATATRDHDLIDFVRRAYASFERRFRDTKGRGFFDAYDRKRGAVERTKSYNSTVYVATAFLLDLVQLDEVGASRHRDSLFELGDIVARHFVDPKTGWIIENFDESFRPSWRGWQHQGENTVGVVGHNFQTAWLLLRLRELERVGTARSRAYSQAAGAILASLLTGRAKSGVDAARGGFFDAFKRESGEPMWHTNKAWWQQAEGILALTLAGLQGVGPAPEARDARERAIGFYLAHFVDWKNGGEFAVVTRDGKALDGADGMKGQKGKSAYHSVELARFMQEYARRARNGRGGEGK